MHWSLELALVGMGTHTHTSDKQPFHRTGVLNLLWCGAEARTDVCQCQPQHCTSLLIVLPQWSGQMLIQHVLGNKIWRYSLPEKSYLYYTMMALSTFCCLNALKLEF